MPLHVEMGERERERKRGIEREGGWWKAADGQLFEQQFRIFNFMANSQWQQLCTLHVCVCVCLRCVCVRCVCKVLRLPLLLLLMLTHCSIVDGW